MRTLARSRVTLLVGLATLVFAPGCTAPAENPAAAPPLRVARVELVNLSDCDWNISISSPRGPDAHAVRLPARETLRVDLPGGDYEITQTALNGIAGPAATRHFPAHLAAGESYRWRHATLLAVPPEAGP